MNIDIKILQSLCCGPELPIREEIETAAAKAGVSVTIEQPTDLQEIIKYGTLTFPSVVVNGEVHDYQKFKNSENLVNLFRNQEMSNI